VGESLDAAALVAKGEQLSQQTTITITLNGPQRVGAVYFDKALSNDDIAELNNLLQDENRLDPIWEFLKTKWPGSTIQCYRPGANLGQVIIWGPNVFPGRKPPELNQEGCEQILKYLTNNKNAEE